ncbi:methyl-accepting chemotaxis protein [Alkalibacillus silvisoli]|uniref:Methyl-accepting chemotaxis protein n=1 Tax=Alkalibacillus silvisoli TaxID=392823 RepID=A0ABN1A9K7_9BACI
MGKDKQSKLKLPKIKNGKKKREHRPKNKKSKLLSMSIGKKYGFVFIITLLLFSIASGLVFVQAYLSDQTINEQVELSEEAITVGEMASVFNSKDIAIGDYVLLKTNNYITEYREQNEQFIELASEVRSGLTEEQAAVLDDVLERNEEITHIVNDDIVSAIGNRDEQDALSSRAVVTSIRGEAIDSLQELRGMVVEEFNASAVDTRNAMLQIQAFLIGGLIASAVIAIIFLTIISRNVNKSINSVVKVADQISEGDLTVDDIPYNGQDEVGRLAQSMNAMKANLKNIIGSVSNASESVTSQGNLVNQAAKEVSEGSEQIASTMQELSSGSETQAQSASSISEMMEQLLSKLQYSYESGDNVSQSSEEVLSMANEGRDMMAQSVTQMQQIHSLVEDSVQKVKGLDHQSNEISKLVQVIEDIAEQTNLLALNAAIEAARAGEHGKGFAVVADEVRKLAEQVSHSVGDITGIVNSIQNESKEVTQSLESGYAGVEEGSQQIKNTQQTFIQINESISDVVSKIQEITSNLKDVMNDSQEMNKSVEEIASISEESAAGVEETAASVEQANSSMEEITSAADDLTKLAEQLNGQVQKFKL